MTKAITVHNPNGLPTLPWRDLHNFQGDLKTTDEARLRKLADSIVRLGVFVPKFVWYEGRGKRRKALILDGHQTRAACELLERDGYEVPPLPCVEVVASDRKDAAEKLLQINSRYAGVNQETTWFQELEFNADELRSLVEGISLPELNVEGMLAGAEAASLLKDFAFEDDQNGDGGDGDGLAERGDDVVVRVRMHPSIWLAHRDELRKLFARLESDMDAVVKIDE